MTGRVPSYSGIRSMFDVKNMTLKFVNDSFSSLSYIFDIAPIAFQPLCV